jgi:hypothetical protein
MIEVSYVAGGGTPGTSGMAFKGHYTRRRRKTNPKDKERSAGWVSVTVMKMKFL